VTRIGAVGCLAVAAAGAAGVVQQPRFKAGVTYVLVDVVVTDKNDRVVRDLTAADFEIREKGRLQRISDFEFVFVPLADRAIDLRAEPLPPPDVGSNAAPPRSSRAIVVAVGPMRPADLVPLKRVLTQFLNLVQPDDLVAFVFAQRSDLGQDFTNDVGRLVRAVNNATAAAGGETRALDVMFKNAVAALAAAPQTRKAIFYVSNGTPLPIAPETVRDARGNPTTQTTVTRLRAGDALDRFLDVFEQARHAGIPIYTIDPHGPASPESVSNIGAITSPSAREGLVSRIQLEHNFLHLVADNTGGRAFVNQSNLEWATQQIVAENGGYYLLGYYPEPWVADGEFHPIEVKVLRPGVRVRGREGYMTEKKLPAALARPPRLVDSLRDGVAGGDLLLRAFAAPIAPSRRGARTYLTLDVSYPAVETERKRADDHLQLAWVALDPDARILASGESTLRLPIDRTRREAFTLSINQIIDAPRGKTILRVAASSELLEARGSVHMPLEVPRLAGEPVAIASLVLAASANAGIRVAHIGDSATALPFQPTTHRTFSSKDSVGVFTRVFAAAPGSLIAELTLRQADNVVRVTPFTLTPAKNEKQALDGQAVVSFAGLPPGIYVLDVTARGKADLSANRAVVITVQ
jgi:VWFA-related protein